MNVPPSREERSSFKRSFFLFHSILLAVLLFLLRDRSTRDVQSINSRINLYARGKRRSVATRRRSRVVPPRNFPRNRRDAACSTLPFHSTTDLAVYTPASLVLKHVRHQRRISLTTVVSYLVRSSTNLCPINVYRISQRTAASTGRFS